METVTDFIFGGSKLTAEKSGNIKKSYNQSLNSQNNSEILYYFTNGSDGTFDIIKPNGIISEGNHKNFSLSDELTEKILGNQKKDYFRVSVFNIDSICKTDKLDGYVPGIL